MTNMKIAGGTGDDGRPQETRCDRATAFILKEIIDGRIGPGARINEQDVAQRLDMSRGPVREAIRGLSARGLLSFEPNVGARVVLLDPKLIADLYEVRAELEGLAARNAAKWMTEEDRAALLDLLAQHDLQIEKEPLGPYPLSSFDHDFHTMILQGSKNRMVWRICGHDLRDLLILVRRQHSIRPGRGRDALQEHRQIAEAIVKGNSPLAELLMVQHIEASRESLLASLSVISTPQRRR
ncbi:GntR family transcriptional regulator [Microbaculum marinum]|uniref:GntR family transcriptional regulator n=1 Tax=Microbaculum marinum TaxID=1764581 RepID=A0AAW9RBA8_9HYPH